MRVVVVSRGDPATGMRRGRRWSGLKRSVAGLPYGTSRIALSVVRTCFVLHGSVGQDACEGADPHLAHVWVAMDVVPDGPRRLLEGPRLAVFPLEVATIQIVSERLVAAPLEGGATRRPGREPGRLAPVRRRR